MVTNKSSKMEDTWVETGKYFEEFKRIRDRNISLYPSKHLVEQMYLKTINWIWPLPTVRNKMDKTSRKVFWSELLEICRTWTEMSRPDMLKFHEILADHNLFTVASRGTRCKLIFKGSSLTTKGTNRIKDFSRKRGFNGKSVWRFQTKKTETFFWTSYKT